MLQWTSEARPADCNASLPVAVAAEPKGKEMVPCRGEAGGGAGTGLTHSGDGRKWGGRSQGSAEAEWRPVSWGPEEGAAGR